ncbi:MAG: co-chaperone GroES [Bacillota bacterium]
MPLKPIADRIVVKPLEAEEKTKSGIILPDTAKERPQMGEVVAVGSGAADKNGKTIPPAVKKGDRVLFASYAGTEVKYQDEKLLIMRESDLLAVV